MIVGKKTHDEITEVIYPFRGIKEIEGFEKLRKLQYINLSFNNLSKLTGLDKCSELQVLDASYNQLTLIEGLHTLNKLTTVYLHNNKIVKIDDVYAFKFNANLKEFSIRGNPFSFNKSYKSQVLQLLPGVTVLDGQEVSTKDKQNTIEQSALLSDELILEASKLQAQPHNVNLLKNVGCNFTFLI